MKNIIFQTIIMLLFGSNLLAQTGVGIYDFSDIPQTNLENPAYKTHNQGHVSIPVLGNHQVFIGSSGITANDVFAKNAIPFNEKLQTAVYNMNSDDVFLVQQQSELINIGYQYQDYFLSFGIYEEGLLYSNFPSGLSKLFYEGTTYLDKKYAIDGYSIQSNITSVYHFGAQKQWNEDTNIGIRLKIYNQGLDARVTNAKGRIFTSLGTDNLYRYTLENADLEVHTSGLVIKNYDEVDQNYIIKNVLLSGNKGIGIDLGYTRNYESNWYLSTSLLDLGFIAHTKNTKNYSAKGTFSTEGIELQYDVNNPEDYWNNLETEFDKRVDYQENDDTYFSLRPIQWNTMLMKKLKKRRLAECTYLPNTRTERDYGAAWGVFTKIQVYNRSLFPSASVFYEHYFGNFLDVRASYSANRFSYTNLGATASFKIWKINLYSSVDNILGLTNLAKTNSADVQFGLNVIW
jgi:hypothetical protein